MSTNLSYDSDSKKLESEHVEYNDNKDVGVTSNGHHDTFEYPAHLRTMPEPPSEELLRGALNGQAHQMSLGLSNAIKKEWRLLLCCLPYFISCMGQGFDSGAMNITGSMPDFLLKFGGFDPVTHSLAIESTWLSLWTSFFQLGTAIGSFLCIFVMDRFGPRVISMITSVFMIMPIALQVFANTKGMLLAGKFLAGIPLGMFVISAANFISEASPVRLRGPLSTIIPFWLVGGICLGIAAGSQVIGNVGYPGADWDSWRLVLACQWAFPAVALIGLFFVPTSPVYLVKRGKPLDALKVLKRLHGGNEEYVRGRLATIQYAVAVEAEQHAKFGAVSYKDLFNNPVDRKRTVTSMLIWITFQLGGTAFLGQGLYFLQQQGLDIVIATDITLAMLALSAFTNFAAGWSLEKFGRRFCFVYFHIIHCTVMLLIGILGFYNQKNKAAGWVMAVLMNLGISTQQFSTNGPGYALMNELSSVRLRAKTISLSLLTQALIAWVMTIIVPYIFQSPGNLGAKTGLIFAASGSLMTVWAYFYIPETKGRTPLELDALYEAKVPARAFRTTDVKALLAAQGHQQPEA